eukprot:CAMPEP_0170428648 /NCGR_PEP_ID=MMETSP0117_2-20130122/39882_1 /TAXON_ID=400756 /ORGANISM="Durinskia baltica, Strain CSIRO CS-38" /LENGTH=37 /DNA_ID= /DNA_START= /DNA_END= /DNA_ORIENTATION=
MKRGTIYAGSNALKPPSLPGTHMVMTEPMSAPTANTT